MASKGLGPLPTRRGSALARGCGMGGRVVLPLARAAAVWTGLRVLVLEGAARVEDDEREAGKLQRVEQRREERVHARRAHL